jgi:hypothetical protein
MPPLISEPLEKIAIAAMANAEAESSISYNKI